jgi:hypothetical protein
MPRLRVEFTKDSLRPGIKKLVPVLNRNLLQVMKFHEPQAASEMKRTAPWTDRTGNARNGLSAKASADGDIYTLTLYGKVKYQIYLETRWSGLRAVIMPTVRSYGPKVLGSLRKLLDRLNLGEK